ncbi:MAG: hypothetical protein HGA90_07960 [Alphaproteobacteria bacterium]|nr:hypothetical protein [Alphaproteobacteria bacterium]
MGFRRAPVATDRRLKTARIRADYGPAERWQHSGRALELTEQAGVLAARALEEHALDVLALRRWITEAQRDAAFRLKRDYRAAGLEARVTGGYNPARVSFSPFGSWDERSDAEEAAYQRWRSALRVLGASFSDTVVSVACHDCMPPPELVFRLRRGLELLATWYGAR